MASSEHTHSGPPSAPRPSRRPSQLSLPIDAPATARGEVPASMRPPPSPQVATWRPPEDLNERFRRLRPIDSGGMGQVYSARDTELDRESALKFILAVEPDEHARERFMREARAAAKIRHPNVVTVYDVGEYEGRAYIVMELLSGKTFYELSKPIECSRVLKYGVALAAALGAAHDKGILHRDMKPGNVFLTNEDEVKIIDFGLAKFLSRTPSPKPTASPHPGTLRTGAAEDARTLTEAGVLVGTLDYLAPECWLGGGKATERSDVYSLGAVLFELCTGRTVFPGLPPYALSRAVRERDAPSLTDLVPDVNPVLAEIVARCLARDPEARYASGKELYEALRDLGSAVASRPISAGELCRSHRFVTAASMVFREIGSLVVSVIPAEPPMDAEWNAYLALCQRKMSRDRIRVLVVSAGGVPTRPQRLALRDLVERGPVPVAVVSEAERVRNVVAEQRGLNGEISTFKELDDALVFLGVEGPMAARVRREVGEMRREVA